MTTPIEPRKPSKIIGNRIGHSNRKEPIANKPYPSIDPTISQINKILDDLHDFYDTRIGQAAPSNAISPDEASQKLTRVVNKRAIAELKGLLDLRDARIEAGELTTKNGLVGLRVKDIKNRIKALEAELETIK